MATAGGNHDHGVVRTRPSWGAALPIVGERFCRASEERHLTVRKTSLFYPGDGFAVYEHHRHQAGHPEEGGVADSEETGELVFRVDSYGPHPHHHHHATAREELILMAPDGDCILTVRRKWPSLHQRWEGFLGERAEGQRPLFSIRRYSIIGRSSAGIGVEVYGDQLGGAGTGHIHYRVEGSFPQRCCAVYEVRPDGGMEEVQGEEEAQGGGGGSGGSEAVAEIRRKVVPCAAAADTAASDSVVVLGRDVFSLRLSPGFDAAFVMGLVLVLDRMTGDDGGDGRDEELPWRSGQPPAPAAAGDGEG